MIEYVSIFVVRTPKKHVKVRGFLVQKINSSIVKFCVGPTKRNGWYYHDPLDPETCPKCLLHFAFGLNKIPYHPEFYNKPNAVGGLKNA